ncbi:cupin domain-containing protein [Burkholderia gladioli]|uniref:cupin domain-containing protein n=1 Tax=Burkholderia gladioli TaxID=28095 RepID=UPI002651F25C|nr:cupin domain-containing protein [Burkholderia gladioli]MDN7754845.1 cupin domain-containing protein [Burkholderia gladioli]
MASETAKTKSVVSVGSKIRSLRQRQGRTLGDIATAAQLSKPFLSQVERDRASPSLTSLVSIAKALGVPASYFVDTPIEEGCVRRRKDLQYFAFADSTDLFARLSNPSGDRQLEAILVRMPPGERPSEVTTHAGEEFVHVLSGEVTITLEGKSFVLGAGDSAHYEATVSHSWKNTRADEAVLVWVGTPRLF